MRRLLVTGPMALMLGGCGATVTVSTSVRTSTTVTTVAGERSFSAPGMAIHFSYPAAFRASRVNSVGRRLERVPHATRAALVIGSSGYDLLIVTRYPRIVPPISAGNIRAHKAYYDGGVSRIFGRRMTGSVASVGALPVLRYPDAPTPGVPVRATTRATFVFVGRDEYELQCQWTAAERAEVAAACEQMLRTVHA